MSTTIRRTLAGVAVAAALLTAGSAPAWAGGSFGLGTPSPSTTTPPPSGGPGWVPITKVVNKTVVIPQSAGVSSAETAGIGVGGLVVGAGAAAVVRRRRTARSAAA